MGEAMYFKMTGGVAARSRHLGVANSWPDRQWAELPPERRPEGGVRIGPRRFELTPEGRPGAGSSAGDGGPSGPSDAPRRAGAIDRPWPADGLIVDPSSPAVREFLHRSTLEGLIRTVPAGPGRILVLPTPLWSRGRPGPDVAQ